MNNMKEIRIEKITLNIGTGKPGPELDKAKILLEKISGRKSIETKTTKRIPGWKIRPGLPIGAKVTLRGKKAVEVLSNELKSLRTGRASTGLVENIRADFYGTPTPLKQMATLATPQGDMIVIKPFDPSSIKAIEKAIKNSDLSMAPIIDGKMVRLNIPPLSEERRRQLSAQAKQLGEHAKVSIRNIRRSLAFPKFERLPQDIDHEALAI